MPAWILIGCASSPLPAAAPLPPPPPTYKADAERQAALGRVGAVPERWVYDGDAFEPLPDPMPGDWLEDHPEAGQTVAAFVRAERRQPDGELVLTPFATDRGVGDLAEILSVYLGVPVVARDLGVEVAGLPGRIHPATGEAQLYTEALLDQLATRRLEGAWGVLGVTSVDLSPNADWNFVFGQARYTGGVGVFSATARPIPPPCFAGRPTR